jgi:hypothetical protein
MNIDYRGKVGGVFNVKQVGRHHPVKIGKVLLIVDVGLFIRAVIVIPAIVTICFVVLPGFFYQFNAVARGFFFKDRQVLDHCKEHPRKEDKDKYRSKVLQVRQIYR